MAEPIAGPPSESAPSSMVRSPTIAQARSASGSSHARQPEAPAWPKEAGLASAGVQDRRLAHAVADVVVQGDLPASLREEIEARRGCVAGALEEGEYRCLLTAAGFAEIEIEVTRVYELPPSPDGGDGGASGRAGPAAKGQFQGGQVVSAFIRARKPPIR